MTQASIVIRTVQSINRSEHSLHLITGQTNCGWLFANVSNVDDQTTAASILENRSSRPFILSFWERVVWQLLFATLVTVSIWGNMIVMWIILAHREMRTVTNYFLFNLSVTDFLMATFNAIFNFIYMLDSHWPFGSVYCTVNNFISCVTVASSVFTMVAMSFERYG